MVFSLLASSSCFRCFNNSNTSERVFGLCITTGTIFEDHKISIGEDLQGYLDLLFVFIMDPPANKLKKAERFLEMAVRKRV